jgi:dynein heavy chain, axonemal
MITSKTHRSFAFLADFMIFRTQYRATKKKLLTMAKGKQFAFDEDVIFGRFERFGRRLEKISDMFSSIRQFSALEEQKIDGMESVNDKFSQLILDFKGKGHDLLDYTNTAFERDFVEFTMNNSALENAIREFIEKSFSRIVSIDQSLQLLKQFRSILHREALQEELDHKYMMIFKSYGAQLHQIQDLYERYKTDPPIPSNFPKISGNIHWSRQLLRRITGPMEKFKANPKVFHPKESRKIVKHYNKLARVLIEFETLWFKAWCDSTEQAKLGLQSRLIVRHPDNGRLNVNFDRRVFTLMREAKNLRLIGFTIPPSASVVLLLQDKLKGFYNEVAHVLASYNRVVHLVSPVAGSLLKPHLLDLENKIRPGMTTMNWTSMSIESFLAHVRNGIARLEYLLLNINDLVENRIRKNLQMIGRVLLVDIPSDCALPVAEFVKRQRAHIQKCQRVLLQKNLEVERAVDDLIAAVLTYPLDPYIAKTTSRDINKVKQYYSGGYDGLRSEAALIQC